MLKPDTRVIWEEPDPRGAYWPRLLLEGTVFVPPPNSAGPFPWNNYPLPPGAGYVYVNTGIYTIPPRADVRIVRACHLVY